MSVTSRVWALRAAVVLLVAGATFAGTLAAPGASGPIVCAAVLIIAAIGWAQARLWGVPAILGWLTGFVGLWVYLIYVLAPALGD